MPGQEEDSRRVERARAFDEVFQAAALAVLHGVVQRVVGLAEIDDLRDVRVTQAVDHARFAQEAFLGIFVVGELLADDLQRDVAAQVRVEGLVRHAHCAASQLPQGAIGMLEHLVVLESFRFGHRSTRRALHRACLGVSAGPRERKPENNTLPPGAVDC